MTEVFEKPALDHMADGKRGPEPLDRPPGAGEPDPKDPFEAGEFPLT